jgi:N-acetylglucosaminyldiphosphoundecaprenol N-acetyl-beta-D-mannosaminyltransferase
MESGERFRIATVNPEYLLEAKRNRRFHESLRRADLALVDGFGIVLMARLFGQKLERYPGADLLSDMLEKAEAKNIPVFLALAETGLSRFEDIRAALAKRYPRVRVSLLEDPLSLPRAAVVLCNYGAPLQEYFLDQLPGGSVRMGIGGAFDFLTGALPRAPRFFRASGLEWLWRLMLQPKRLPRIFRATVAFPISFLLDTIRK